MKYKRVLLKMSGEALAGKQGFGISTELLNQFAQEVADLHKNKIQVGIVLGAGNIHRGAVGAQAGMDRTTSDYMGMMGTIINSLAMQDALERKGISTRVMSAIDISAAAEKYIKRRALRHFEKGRVLIFAAGTGHPFFSTDTAAALRANEIGAEILLKATKVDGVYDKDPVKFDDAVMYDRLSYIDVLSQNLKVMDATATSLCMDNDLDIIVFNLFTIGNVLRIVKGEKVGTYVTKSNKGDK